MKSINEILNKIIKGKRGIDALRDVVARNRGLLPDSVEEALSVSPPVAKPLGRYKDHTTLKAEWREELHPRDKRGRFTSKPSGGTQLEFDFPDDEGSKAPADERSKAPEYERSRAPRPFDFYGVVIRYGEEDYNPGNQGNHEIMEAAIRRTLPLVPDEHRVLIQNIIIDDDITNNIHPLTNKRVLSDEELKATHYGRDVGAYSTYASGTVVLNGSADQETYFSEKGMFGTYDNILLHEIGHFVFYKVAIDRRISSIHDDPDFDVIQEELSTHPYAVKELLKGNELSNIKEVFCGLYRHYILNGSRFKELLPRSYEAMKRMAFGGREYISKASKDVVPLYVYQVKSGARVYALKPIPGLEGKGTKKVTGAHEGVEPSYSITALDPKGKRGPKRQDYRYGPSQGPQGMAGFGIPTYGIGAYRT